MNKKGKTFGSMIVILGIVILLINFGLIEPFWERISIARLIGRFWPSLFLLLPGVLFHFKFFSTRRTNPGLLVPGGISVVLGLAFQINMLFGGWHIMWPVYIFSVAVGLFELYAFGNREKGLLVPIGILSGLSVVFFFSFSVSKILDINTKPFIVPFILIIIGLVVIFSSKDGKDKKDF